VADREGRFKWRPLALGAAILPFDGVDFSRVLHALGTRGFLVRYRVGDEWFGWIPSFKRHQVINNREKPSVLPDISEAEEVDASMTRGARVGHASKEERKGKEGNKEGKGKEGEGHASPAAPSSSRGEQFDINSLVIPEELKGDMFLEFWPKWAGVRMAMKKPKDGWESFFKDHLSNLKGYGASVAGATVKDSYLNRYQGLFPDKMAGRAISGAANGIPAKPQKSDGGGHEVIMGKYL
jgi:hypothetical protein